MSRSSNTCGYHLFLDVKFFVCRKKVDDQISLHQGSLSEKLLKGNLLEYGQLELKCYKFYFISCFKPCIVLIIFNIARKKLWRNRVMYLLFWYMFILKSPRIRNFSVSVISLSKFAFIIPRKLLWLGGL